MKECNENQPSVRIVIVRSVLSDIDSKILPLANHFASSRDGVYIILDESHSHFLDNSVDVAGGNTVVKLLEDDAEKFIGDYNGFYKYLKNQYGFICHDEEAVLAQSRIHVVSFGSCQHVIAHVALIMMLIVSLLVYSGALFSAPSSAFYVTSVKHVIARRLDGFLGYTSSTSSFSSSSSSSISSTSLLEEEEQSLESRLLKSPHNSLKGHRPSALIEPENTIFVIGDLHGDYKCAKFWIWKTGLIKGDVGAGYLDTSSWEWNDPAARLVFMGDYVDRGPYSYQTLHLVKAITERFPKYAFALLGNHDMAFLLDQYVDDTKRTPSYERSSAFVHPLEYWNWIPEKEKTKTAKEAMNTVLSVLLNKVYPEDESISMSPKAGNSIVNKISDLNEKRKVNDELAMWQQYYSRALTETEPDLGNWLASRPITLILGDFLFVHGGINDDDGRRPMDRKLLERINKEFHSKGVQVGEQLNHFMHTTDEGKAITEMLEYRSNHGNCASVDRIKHELNVHKVIVGHTPDLHVRVNCGRSFIAADSLLGRYIRKNGNAYCLGDMDETSGNGKFKCNAVGESCEGQIVKLSKIQSSSDGDVIIETVGANYQEWVFLSL